MIESPAMKTVQRALSILGLAVAASGAPAQTPPTSDTEPPKEHAKPTVEAADVTPPEAGTLRRVGGDMQVRVEKLPNGFFRCGLARITTELPDGYPDPTPPGAIDLKTYPSVRRAEISGTVSPDIGMNLAFFPLFNHIKQRDIAMTTPVEIDYRKINFNPPFGGGSAPESWTMSFLYRRPDLGPIGEDNRNKEVRVVDTPPVTVVSVGRKGPYRFAASRKLMGEIEQWLTAHPAWEKAGDPRVLHYNGPDVREADQWSEVQWPITRRSNPSAANGNPEAPALESQQAAPAAPVQPESR